MSTLVTEDNVEDFDGYPSLGEADADGSVLLAVGLEGFFSEFVPWLGDAVQRARRCGLDDYEIEDFLTTIGLSVESFRVEANMPGGGGFSVFAWGSSDQEERSRSLIEKAIAGLRELNGETDDDEE